jgi:hypothetical protein
MAPVSRLAAGTYYAGTYCRLDFITLRWVTWVHSQELRKKRFFFRRRVLTTRWGKRAGTALVFCLISMGIYPQSNRTAPAAAPQATSPKTPPVSPAAAKVSRILQEFVEHFELRSAVKDTPDKVVRLTEAEVNAYLQEEVRIKAEKYPELKSLTVKFIGPNYIGVTAAIDFQKVKQLDSNAGLRSIRALLTGIQEIYVEGTLSSADRMAQFKLEKAYLGRLRLPVTMIEFLVEQIAAKPGQSTELSKPFTLPYGLKKVDIQSGSITLRG